MAEGLQKKNLETSPDETRSIGRGEMKTATFGDFKVAREVIEPGWSKLMTDRANCRLLLAGFCIVNGTILID